MTQRSPEAASLWGRTKKQLHNLVVENPGLKLLAILITIVLWLSVSSQKMTETTLREPISYQNIPAGLSIVEQGTETVRLTIRGPHDVLARIRAGEIHLDPIVDLSHFAGQPGKRIITLTTSEVNAPQNVEVLDIKPSRISITLASLANKEVPVEPLFEGQPAPGYVVAGYRVEPAGVAIEGPENHVGQIDKAFTETVLLHGRRDDFELSAAVDVRDPLVEIGTGVVKVYVDLERAERQIIFDNLTVTLLPIADPPQRSRRAKPEFVAQPATVRITLEGEEGAIQTLTRPAIQVTADPAAAAADSTVPVKVSLPPDLANKVRVKQIEPERITIKQK